MARELALALVAGRFFANNPVVGREQALAITLDKRLRVLIHAIHRRHKFVAHNSQRMEELDEIAKWVEKVSGRLHQLVVAQVLLNGDNETVLRATFAFQGNATHKYNSECREKVEVKATRMTMGLTKPMA